MGDLLSLKFSQAAPGPSWLLFYIKPCIPNHPVHGLFHQDYHKIKYILKTFIYVDNPYKFWYT